MKSARAVAVAEQPIELPAPLRRALVDALVRCLLTELRGDEKSPDAFQRIEAQNKRDDGDHVDAHDRTAARFQKQT